MVRTYKRKKPPISEEDVKKAIENVIDGTMTLRGSAAAFGLKRNTLFYRIQNFKKNIKPKSEDYSSNFSTRQVFTNEEEKLLDNYLLKCSKMHYGLTFTQARSLAYDYATALKKCPANWTAKQLAGLEWIKGFMKRHKNLSLRKPENTSLSRATSFNETNVAAFQTNLEKALSKFTFTADRIYNLDETSVTTVVQAPNIIAQTGAKQVGQCVSAERGQLITMCGIVNAAGNSIPPVFVYPRARFHETMLNGAPHGSIGFANSPTSGWMTGTIFLHVMEHIKKHARCNRDDPILLLYDNHETHITIDAITFARENGMIIVTFPPHCTHKMQPLDVAVMGPFKKRLATSQNDWLLNHPGKTITIHDLAGIVNSAYLASFTPRNIISGFQKPGIHPFSRNAFSEEDFECAQVTNRPEPQDTSTSSETRTVQLHSVPSISASSDTALPPTPCTTAVDPTSGNISAVSDPPSSESSDTGLPSTTCTTAVNPISGNTSADSVPASSGFSDTGLPPTQCTTAVDPTSGNTSTVPPTFLAENNILVKDIISPEMIRPYPKADPRKGAVRGRKKGKTRILTDTPEKDEIEAAYLERINRQKKKTTISFLKRSASEKTEDMPTKAKKIRRIRLSSSDDTDSHFSTQSDSEIDDFITDDDNYSDKENTTELSSDQNINVADYVLVKLQSERRSTGLAFVGKVEENYDDVFIVRFLKKKSSFNKFFFPEKEDIWPITREDIITKLPSPKDAGGTSRTASTFTFSFDFTKFKLG